MERSLNHKTKSIIAVTLALLTGSTKTYAQHEVYSKPVWEKENARSVDSLSLLHAFTHGKMSGHFRQFTMATINRGDFPDYYALAIGGGIRLQTARLHRLQFTLSGYFTHNLASSDLGKADEQTGAKNRYETGLFDIEDPYNKNDLDRLEELNINYFHKGINITAGKQILNTPFINPQDGRMRPTEVSGLWAQWQTKDKAWKAEAGYIHKISPRSTTKWFLVSQSIGLYPAGINPDGKPSGYKEQLQSGGIYLVSVSWSPGKQVKLYALNQLTENIFNSALIQFDISKPLSFGQLLGAVQYIRQDAVNHGGNQDQSKSYFAEGGSSNTISGRLSWKNESWQASFNATHIFKGGRYLMPREWGRDPFFTFMQRERNEGYGNLTAWVWKASRSFPGQGLSADVAVGLFDLPDVNDFAHNKYGMPSYGQTNAGLNYRFRGFFQGLQAEFLYAWKWNRSTEDLAAKYVVNKVDMSNINLILNYHFGP